MTLASFEDKGFDGANHADLFRRVIERIFSEGMLLKVADERRG